MNIAKSTLDINSNSGLFAIKRIFNGLSSLDSFNACEKKSQSNSHTFFPTTSIIKSMTALLSLGKTSFEHITSFKHDTLMKDFLQRETVPSKEILRQRIDGISLSEKCIKCVDDVNIDLLKRVKDFGLEKTIIGDVLVVDIDVSVLNNQDTKKEGVQYTYKGCFGFQLRFAC